MNIWVCVKQVGGEAHLNLDVRRLQHLTLSSLSDISNQRNVCMSALAKGLHGLQQHQRLYHLDFSRKMYASIESQGIVDTICGFTSLHSLNFDGIKVFADAAGVCIQGINLWSLKELELAGKWAEAEDAADVLSHIGNMSALNYLNLDCQPFHASSFHVLTSSFSGLSSLTWLSLTNSRLALDRVT